MKWYTHHFCSIWSQKTFEAAFETYVSAKNRIKMDFEKIRFWPFYDSFSPRGAFPICLKYSKIAQSRVIIASKKLKSPEIRDLRGNCPLSRAEYSFCSSKFLDWKKNYNFREKIRNFFSQKSQMNIVWWVMLKFLIIFMFFLDVEGKKLIFGPCHLFSSHRIIFDLF